MGRMSDADIERKENMTPEEAEAEQDKAEARETRRTDDRLFYFNNAGEALNPR